jgi:hypothetical protein
MGVFIENRQKLHMERLEFGKKYGFLHKRPEHYRNCLVIRWKHSTKKIEYSKIDDYVEVCCKVCDHYNLWVKDPFLDTELKVLRIGIYATIHWDYHVWAIPNDYPQVQEFVLKYIPQWVKLKVK